MQLVCKASRQFTNPIIKMPLPCLFRMAEVYWLNTATGWKAVWPLISIKYDLIRERVVWSWYSSVPVEQPLPLPSPLFSGHFWTIFTHAYAVIYGIFIDQTALWISAVYLDIHVMCLYSPIPTHTHTHTDAFTKHTFSILHLGKYYTHFNQLECNASYVIYEMMIEYPYK